jgi:hypothetical protein
MATIVDLILFISLIGLTIGLVKPSAFSKFTHDHHARAKTSLVFSAGLVISLTTLAILGSNLKPSSAASSTNNTTPTATSDSSNTSSQSASNTTNSTPNSSQPALRQDLAFQGDPTYCDGTYRANSDGTTTWTLNIKQDGEIITHLSDNNGHLYRHDVQITDAPNFYAYTAPVAISNVSEINGLLYVNNTSHPCNISPQR